MVGEVEVRWSGREGDEGREKERERERGGVHRGKQRKGEREIVVNNAILTL